MIQVNNVQLKHNGLLTDNTTKLTLYLPECTEEQDVELIKMSKKRTVGIIIVDPDMLSDIQELIAQMKDLLPEKEVLPEPIERHKYEECVDPLPLFTQMARGELQSYAPEVDEEQF